MLQRKQCEKIPPPNTVLCLSWLTDHYPFTSFLSVFLLISLLHSFLSSLIHKIIYSLPSFTYNSLLYLSFHFFLIFSYFLFHCFIPFFIQSFTSSFLHFQHSLTILSCTYQFSHFSSFLISYFSLHSFLHSLIHKFIYSVSSFTYHYSTILIILFIHLLISDLYCFFMPFIHYIFLYIHNYSCLHHHIYSFQTCIAYFFMPFIH